MSTTSRSHPATSPTDCACPSACTDATPSSPRLIKAVDGIALGRAQLVLIAGRSGIGKSSLVREVMRPVAGRRGHLIAGKCDQLDRGTPYRAIGQAFEELVRKLLGETAERVDLWRRTLREAMGPNAQVILDVVPGLVHLVGEMPPAARLWARRRRNTASISSSAGCSVRWRARAIRS